MHIKLFNQFARRVFKYPCLLIIYDLCFNNHNIDQVFQAKQLMWTPVLINDNKTDSQEISSALQRSGDWLYNMIVMVQILY